MSDVYNVLNKLEHYKLLVVGSSDEGKTYFIRCILPYLARNSKNPDGFRDVYIFGEYVLENHPRTNQDPYTQRYLEFRKRGCTVTEDFNPQHLLAWIKFRKGKAKSLLIMDDIQRYALGTGRNGKIMASIFSSCRHANISIISTCHAYTDLPKAGRLQYTHAVFTSITIDFYTNLIKNRINTTKKIQDRKLISLLQPKRFEYLFFNPRVRNQFKKFRI